MTTYSVHAPAAGHPSSSSARSAAFAHSDTALKDSCHNLASAAQQIAALAYLPSVQDTPPAPVRSAANSAQTHSHQTAASLDRSLVGGGD